MTINERLDSLSERLRALEDRLRRSERRLRRFVFLRGEPNAPEPVLTRSEEAYIQSVSAFDTAPVSESELFESYRAAALDILSRVFAAELDVSSRQRAEIIRKSLVSGTSFTAKQIVYVTTQIIQILVNCVSRLPNEAREDAVARLEELIGLEERALPF